MSCRHILPCAKFCKGSINILAKKSRLYDEIHLNCNFVKTKGQGEAPCPLSIQSNTKPVSYLKAFIDFSATSLTGAETSVANFVVAS